MSCRFSRINFNMSDKDSKSGSPPAPESKSSGRVAHDSRGNPVWEWKTEDGKFSRDVTTQRLKKLEAPELTLMDTQTVIKQHQQKKDSGDASASQAKPAPLEVQQSSQGGFNPYNSVNRGKASTSDAARAAHPALVHKQLVQEDKKPVRQSLQSKYASPKPKEEKPTGLLSKLKSIFSKD